MSRMFRRSVTGCISAYARTRLVMCLVRLKAEITSEGGRVDELRSVPPGLEDVFIALTETNNE